MTESNLAAATMRLVQSAVRLGIELSEHQAKQFESYCSLLLEANQRFNLTGLKAPDQVMRTLFLDSLTVTPMLPSEFFEPDRTVQVVDVGAGAGVPGFPLEILFPHWSLLSVESSQKKAAFLRAVARELGLSKVSVAPSRAEEIGRIEEYRDAADLCLARAVAPLPALVELCAPVVRPGGLLAFPKSGDVQAECDAAAAAARALRLGKPALHSVPESLGLGQGANRFIVIYRKLGPTPQEYPRRVGVPTSRPIGSAQAAPPRPIHGRRSLAGSKQRRPPESG